ncbi:SGNH/GDSL hydrolase family protein [Kribbella sp. NPDC051137]|uniref:SGNH/GDSL hydrolase family protein n=1 Tax=Kribbella sp. NPDC051137 TaxID=3155045 RepID=UPI002F5F27F8
MRELVRKALIGGLGLMLALPAVNAGAAPGAGHHWTATWTASPTAAMASGLSHNGLTDQTIRNIVYPTIGGTSVRVRLTNRYGARPVTFDQVTVGQPNGTKIPLTFHGGTSVTIAAGADVAGDPVALPVEQRQPLAISLFSASATGPATYHNAAHTTSYLAAGDHAADTSSDAFTSKTTSWLFVDGIDVVAAPHVGTIVALGDSITDGTGTADNSNTRWSDALFARIAAGPPGHLQAVTNSGIGGNEVTLDRQPPYFGVSAQHRLDADVLDQPGVSLVLVAEGINDLTASNVPADKVIGGLQGIADRTHAAGLKIVGLTITPCGGYGVCGAGPLGRRAIVNNWIRTSGAFDAVVDFDAVVRDPANPDHLLAAYDSGDHLHPNAAAYQQLADSMDLPLLGRLVSRHPR